MNHSNSLSRLSIAAAFGMLIAFGIPMSGQEVPLQKEAPAPKPAQALNEVLRHNIEYWILQGRGIPEDWSHHRLVFSNPGTEEEAIENGTHDRWLRIVNDPRYVLQQLQRLLPGQQGADVILQRLVFLPLPKGSDCFQSESKGSHGRLAGDALAGIGVDIVCISASQLCAVVNPSSTPW